MMKQIGKGAFSTCYKRTSNTVLIKSCDPIKECMAHGWFPDSHLFPKVKFHGNSQNEYVMKYYPKVKSLKKNLKPSHYEFYKELRQIYDDLFFSRDFHEIIKGFKGIKCPNRRRIMIQAVEACANYGADVAFEISPRNVAVSPTGGLVLLDCFFMKSKLKEVRS